MFYAYNGDTKAEIGNCDILATIGINTMHASFHNIKKIILENVEKREADHGTFYVFTMKITDETGNDNVLAFFSDDKNGLDFIKKDNS